LNTMIYLDNHSTTKLDSSVLERILPFLKEEFGNPSAKSHPLGWHAAEAVDDARRMIAKILDITPREVLFTSGATESNNLIIQGFFKVPENIQKYRFLTQATEHKSVLSIAKLFQSNSQSLDRPKQTRVLGVDAAGMMSLVELEEELQKGPALVSVMLGNNEIGTINDVKTIYEICDKYESLLHLDAAQAPGKVDLKNISYDFLSLSAHKFHGPKGVGALIVKNRSPRLKFAPLMVGGTQEMELRPGTTNVAGIVGMAYALELAQKQRAQLVDHWKQLRIHFLSELETRGIGFEVNGSLSHRLENNLSLTFTHLLSSEILKALMGKVALSTGSACSTGAVSPSHVLKAIGLTDDQCARTVRLGMGPDTTKEQMTQVVDLLSHVAATGV